MNEHDEKRLTTADMVRMAENRPDGEAEANNKNAAKAVTAQAPALLPGNEVETMRSRWHEIQTGFVDEPRKAVEDADSLVAEAMKRLAEVFSQERSRLEEQWSRGNDVSTEDLRVGLQRYRSFFDRLLSI